MAGGVVAAVIVNAAGRARMTWAIIIATLTVFAAGVALLFCGCGNQPDGVIRIALGNEPESIDPRKARGKNEWQVTRQIYEGLVQFDRENNIIPATAANWEVSADGMRYAFHIRPDARWSDGEAVTAEDFRFSWLSHLEPQFGSATADKLYVIRGARLYNEGRAAAETVGIACPDTLTLVAELEHPDDTFLQLLTRPAFFPVCRKAAASGMPVCNGPYMLAGWEKSRLRLTRNPHYYDAANVGITAAEFIVAMNPAACVSMLQNSGLDIFANPPPADAARLENEGLLRMIPQAGTYFYDFNNGKPPFSDAAIRRAFLLATERRKLAAVSGLQDASAAAGLVPPGIRDWNGLDFRTNGGTLLPDTDVVLANRILDERGYADRSRFPEVTLLYNSGDEHKSIAQALQEMWKKNLGISVKLRAMETKAFQMARRNYEYDIVRDGWVDDIFDAAEFFREFSGADKRPKANYHNREFSGLLRAADVSSGQRRSDLLHAAEKILLGDYAILPLYYISEPVCVSRRVAGFEYNALGDMNIKNMRLTAHN